MKKLTFSTLGCPGYDLGQIVSLAKRFGLDQIELRGAGNDPLDIDKISILQPENMAATAEFLAKSGVKICSLDCSAFLANPSARIEECAFALRAAAKLGVPFIRVFGGDSGDHDADIIRVAERINNLCELEPTVTVLLETHDSFSDADSIRSVVSRVKRPNFGILWDAEHTIRAGVDSAEFVGEFAPLIKHVHLKDYGESGLCLPGDGLIDLRGIRDLLEKAGYDGLFSLEWEKRWVKELPDIEPALERFVKIMM